MTAITAVVIAIFSAYLVFRPDVPQADKARPAMVIGRFTAGPGLPTHFPDDLREAIVGAFPPSAFDLRRGDARRDARAFQLTGRAERQGEGLAVTVQLRIPDSDESMWSRRFERPAANATVARGLGMEIQQAVKCISDGSDKRVTATLPRAKLPLWVAYCDTLGIGAMDHVDRLRAVVAAAPEFDVARLSLAAALGDLAMVRPAQAAVFRAEGERHARASLKVDPNSPKAWGALALLRPALDFSGREKLFLRALAGDPSACGCEHQTYSYFLSMVGRGREAEENIRRTVSLVPSSLAGYARLGETLAVNRQYGAAASVLTKAAEQWPEESYISTLRYKNATFANDWPTARAMLVSAPDNPAKPLLNRIVEARAANDAARLRTAGNALMRLLADPQFLTRGTVSALALAGLDIEAVEAAGRMIDESPFYMTVLYEPPFERARRLPQFAALVSRLGLLDYWRKSGRAPNFCLAADAPSLCTELRRLT